MAKLGSLYKFEGTVGISIDKVIFPTILFVFQCPLFFSFAFLVLKNCQHPRLMHTQDYSR
jgi:hypothetical protein